MPDRNNRPDPDPVGEYPAVADDLLALAAIFLATAAVLLVVAAADCLARWGFGGR